MRRVSPSVFAREELHRLLAGGADREANIVSAFVEAVSGNVTASWTGDRGSGGRSGQCDRTACCDVCRELMQVR
jgi:hypothetical protein